MGPQQVSPGTPRPVCAERPVLRRPGLHLEGTEAVRCSLCCVRAPAPGQECGGRLGPRRAWAESWEGAAVPAAPAPPAAVPRCAEHKDSAARSPRRPGWKGTNRGGRAFPQRPQPSSHQTCVPPVRPAPPRLPGAGARASSTAASASSRISPPPGAVTREAPPPLLPPPSPPPGLAATSPPPAPPASGRPAPRAASHRWGQPHSKFLGCLLPPCPFLR